MVEAVVFISRDAVGVMAKLIEDAVDMGFCAGRFRVYDAVRNQNVGGRVVSRICATVQIDRPVKALRCGIPQAGLRIGVVPQDRSADRRGTAVIHIRQALKPLCGCHILRRVQASDIKGLCKGVVLSLLLPDAAVGRAEAGGRNVIQNIICTAAVCGPDMIQEFGFFLPGTQARHEGEGR